MALCLIQSSGTTRGSERVCCQLDNAQHCGSKRDVIQLVCSATEGGQPFFPACVASKEHQCEKGCWIRRIFGVNQQGGPCVFIAHTEWNLHEEVCLIIPDAAVWQRGLLIHALAQWEARANGFSSVWSRMAALVFLKNSEVALQKRKQSMYTHKKSRRFQIFEFIHAFHTPLPHSQCLGLKQWLHYEISRGESINTVTSIYSFSQALPSGPGIVHTWTGFIMSKSTVDRLTRKCALWNNYAKLFSWNYDLSSN